MPSISLSGEQILDGETEGQTTDAASCQYTRDAEAERLHRDQDGDDNHCETGQLRQCVKGGAVQLLALFFADRDNITGNVANQPEQKPGEADDDADITQVRYRLKKGRITLLADDVGRHGNAYQPDQDR